MKIVICLLLIIISQACTAKTLTLEMHEKAEERGLVCNDGSPGGYYVHYENGSNLWLFFQQGGGWCYDIASCTERIILPITVGITNDLISSKTWPSQRNIHGLFDLLAHFNLVYIPYCSSDAHMADTEKTILLQKVHFRGRRLAFDTITRLIGSKSNQLVIFGGLSAGGRGSMVTIDALRPLLPATTTLIGLHDSGNYVDLPPLDPFYDPFLTQCQRAYETFNSPPISPNCQAFFAADPWKCLCGAFMLPLLQTPSQVIIHQFDSYQLYHDLRRRDPENWKSEDCQYANYQFR